MPTGWCSQPATLRREGATSRVPKRYRGWLADGRAYRIVPDRPPLSVDNFSRRHKQPDVSIPATLRLRDIMVQGNTDVSVAIGSVALSVEAPSNPGLMAIGEAASVSVHGANRLGCNSLLDHRRVRPLGSAAGRRDRQAGRASQTAATHLGGFLVYTLRLLPQRQRRQADRPDPRPHAADHAEPLRRLPHG